LITFIAFNCEIRLVLICGILADLVTNCNLKSENYCLNKTNTEDVDLYIVACKMAKVLCISCKMFIKSSFLDCAGLSTTYD